MVLLLVVRVTVGPMTNMNTMAIFFPTEELFALPALSLWAPA